MSEAQERSALFVSLAERLLQGDAGESESRHAHLLRLLTSLMPAVDESARKALVERVAQMPSPPKDLALRLARDEAEIAAPILKHTPFSQQELVELVSRSGPEHHIEIAKRADLTLDVWLALARAAAQRARISDTPASKRPDTLTEGDKASESPPRTAIREEAGGQSKQAPVVDGEESVRAPISGENSLPLEDRDDHSWRFETDREGCLSRLSPNAALAFGQPASALLGDSLADLLQAHAAAPTSDEIGNAMRRRVPLRDLVVETMPPDGGRPRQWSLSAQPRFSFPDGRFEGYVGTARDRESDFAQNPSQSDPEHLLERLGRAADKLAQSAATPELAEYARVMKDYVEALRLSQSGEAGTREEKPRRSF